MKKIAMPKSLKDQNRWQLWLIIAANFLVFFTLVQSNGFVVSDIRSLLGSTSNLLPLGLTIVITSVANGLLSADMKARLVFLRWQHALPGHRAFSKYAASDPRIDIDSLENLFAEKAPTDAESENRAWYKLYKEVEAEPAVEYIHREFLLTRDYTGIAALFLIVFGAVSLFLVQVPHVSLTYCLLLILQFLFARQAAATYGARFVCTVLALKAAKSPKLKPTKAKDRSKKSAISPLT